MQVLLDANMGIHIYQQFAIFWGAMVMNKKELRLKKARIAKDI